MPNKEYKPIYMFKIPNDNDGQYFLHLLKKYIAPEYKIRLRGCTPDNKKIKRDKINRNFCNDLPAKYAKNFRVYITDKQGHTVDYYQFEQYRKAWDMEQKAKLAEVQRNKLQDTVNFIAANINSLNEHIQGVIEHE